MPKQQLKGRSWCWWLIDGIHQSLQLPQLSYPKADCCGGSSSQIHSLSKGDTTFSQIFNQIKKLRHFAFDFDEKY